MRGINLTLPQPGLTVLLGANGAGKSSLLQVLAGISLPDSGTLELGADSRAFIMPEPAAFYPQLTVQQQLAFVLSLSDELISPNRLEALLQQWQLTHVADKLTQHLSLGYRQRLSLAQLSASAADLLLLDEPMNGMDHEILTAFKAQVQQWKQSKSIVMATHIMHEAQDLADWVVVMELGQVIHSAAYDGKQSFSSLYQQALQDFRHQTVASQAPVSA